MKITSLKLAKLYSFGPVQELSDFSSFNLFIGPNGSGKTNLLRVLSGLPYDFSKLGDVSTQIPTHTAGIIQKTITTFVPAFHEMSNTVINRDTWASDIKGNLTINYEVATSTEQVASKKEQIICSDSPDGHMQFDKGDVVSYARRVANIVLPETDHVFYKLLCQTLQAAACRKSILNFGLFYIFKLHYDFYDEGTFVQGKKARNGTVERDYQTLPSGVLQVAKLLTSILGAQDKPILLIDEPELHIELRHLRALFEFLVWYCSRSKNDVQADEKKIVERVDRVLQDNSINERPIWGDINEKIGNTLHGKQVFISSHSSVLINEFLRLTDSASLYEFRLEEKTYKRVNKVAAKYGQDQSEADCSGVFSIVRKIDNQTNSILDNLGCRGSDLLQCNGVVWVEGPSDVVYIRKWIEMYANEGGKPVPQQGRDYEFQMYGGTLLDSICVMENGNQDDEALKKIVKMFSFSRNAYVVIDSDATKTQSGEIVDQSNFSKAKTYIKCQIKVLNDCGANLGLWYESGNTEVKTIEDYLDEKSINSVAKSIPKKQRAQRIVAMYDENKKLADFKDGLKAQTESLFNAIERWNRI